MNGSNHVLVKEYYRITELKDRFNVSVEDIKYLVENSKIELVFYNEVNQYIFGGWLEGKGFVGYGSLNYSGLVKIAEQEQRKLLLNENISIKSFRLLNKKNISNVNHNYPYKSPLPNAFLYAWQPKAIKDIEWIYIPAKLFHHEKEHHFRSMGNMIKDAMSSFDTAQEVLAKTDTSVFDKAPKKGFYHEGIELQFSDSCVLHDDLVKLNIIQQELSNNSNAQSCPSKRPIDTLLISILKQFPKDKPAELWSKLQADISQATRLLDIDEIIDEVGEKELFWYDLEGEPQTLKRKSFYNLIRKLKIN
jgi:hypothetical protein